MSDLASRLRQRASMQEQEKAAETQVADFQAKVNDYITANARAEFDRLQSLLTQKIAETNPHLGELPPFEFNVGWRMISQGNCVAGIIFDQPIMNNPTNRLAVNFAPNPNNHYFFTAPPRAIRYMLQAAAQDDFSGIVWTGDLGEVTSEYLSEFILETLTEYYLENKPEQT